MACATVSSLAGPYSLTVPKSGERHDVQAASRRNKFIGIQRAWPGCLLRCYQSSMAWELRGQVGRPALPLLSATGNARPFGTRVYPPRLFSAIQSRGFTRNHAVSGASGVAVLVPPLPRPAEEVRSRAPARAPRPAAQDTQEPPKQASSKRSSAKDKMFRKRRLAARARHLASRGLQTDDDKSAPSGGHGKQDSISSPVSGGVLTKTPAGPGRATQASSKAASLKLDSGDSSIARPRSTIGRSRDAVSSVSGRRDAAAIAAQIAVEEQAPPPPAAPTRQPLKWQKFPRVVPASQGSGASSKSSQGGAAVSASAADRPESSSADAPKPSAPAAKKGEHGLTGSWLRHTDTLAGRALAKRFGLPSNRDRSSQTGRRRGGRSSRKKPLRSGEDREVRCRRRLVWDFYVWCLSVLVEYSSMLL